MTKDEWNEKLETLCTTVTTAHKDLITHVEGLPAVSDIKDVDMEEFMAVFQVKMNRVQRAIAA